MTRLLLACALALAPHAALPVAAAPADPGLQSKLEAISRTVEARRVALHIPGIALAIVKDGRPIYLKGFGERDVAHHQPVTPDTLFAIGSVTKGFTALACEMAQDDGKLSIDDSPKKVLPYFKLKDPEADQKITLRDMLSHRSGVGRSDFAMLSGQLSREELIRVLADAKPVSKFREGFNYQNQMFVAAGEIAGRVEGQSYETLVNRRIFAPLGMKSACWTPQAMQSSKDFAQGYVLDQDTGKLRVVPPRDFSVAAPAGGINASVRDMARWVQFMLDGGVANGQRLISERGFAELLSPQNDFGPAAYGLGWTLTTSHGHKVAMHGGNIDGFNATVALMPDQHLGLVLLTNVGDSPLSNEILDMVWKPMLGLPTAIGETKTVHVDPAIARPLIGDYHNEEANFGATVSLREGQPAIIFPSQPPYPLLPTTPGTYRLSGLPDGFFVTAQYDSQGRVTGLLLTQPDGKYLIERVVPYVAPLTTEQLYAKRIAAQGGENALARHYSLVTHARVDYLSQGVSGTSVTRKLAPSALETVTHLAALSKPIGWIREFTDGRQAGIESSAALPVQQTGKALVNTLLSADFNPLLTWKSCFSDVTITGTAKVNDEDCYVIKALPIGGDPVMEFVSTRSFLLLKRETQLSLPNSEATYPVIEHYSDYRSVDGVQLPFKVRNESVFGTIETELLDAQFDQLVTPDAFVPRL
ncbi:Beta-lactamase precursor [compost metagenome]